MLFFEHFQIQHQQMTFCKKKIKTIDVLFFRLTITKRFFVQRILDDDLKKKKIQVI